MENQITSTNARSWKSRVTMVLLIVTAALVVTGPSAQSSPTNTLSAVCVDWFYSNKSQVHAVVHVEDDAGNPVVGATVTTELSLDNHKGQGPVVYSTRVSQTVTGYTYGGSKGETCGNKSLSTTSAFCRKLGSKGSTTAGLLSGRVTNVVPPAGSGLVWDGISPANGREMWAGGNT